MIRTIHRPSLLIAVFAWIAGAAGCGANSEQNLFLNLFEVGEDPFLGVERIEATLDGTGSLYTLDPAGNRSDFGPIPGGEPCRIELRGTGAEPERISWGFSPPLRLDGGTHKTTVFFSRDDTAVAHAGPSLVDPDEGLAAAGLPLSLRTASVAATVAWNAHYLIVDMTVEDDQVVANSPEDPWSGDLVFVVLDSLGDSSGTANGPDDFVIALGEEAWVPVWAAQQSAVMHRFTACDGGYRAFVGLPIADQLVDGPEPGLAMQLGIEIQDRDGTGGVQTLRWPQDWTGAATPGDAHSYTLEGAGRLALKTRVLDAREVGRNAIGFDPGIDDFLGSGAVRLNHSPAANEDDLRVYAAWNNQGLYLALASDDAVLCTQQRDDGDREAILRDDAVELVVVNDHGGHRALFNLTGSIAYDRPGGEAWPAGEIYFRFDLGGDVPADDCREGTGYTFKVVLPWAELGYEAQPPDLEETFGFDLVVYDNDRGAHVVTPFSPMGPTEEERALGELRLFAY